MRTRPDKKSTFGRKLKIYPKYFSRSRNNIIFPEIRLSGKWLYDLGFHSGKEIQIEEEKDKIIITLVNS